ncbi:hypothetical protein [Amycolatopsis sp. CA-128772]|uniref:hypothetical protein n=1 Tax=Amycolatopsis sp. CA-128772 TaxID=2073159 RepID=UPI0011AFE748|nr:hypothetical protein [Amycolatopsis sp. CA-128772]
MLRYSRAYPPEAVGAFGPAADWVAAHPAQGPLFLWDDLSVTADAFADEPAYRDESAQWHRFCHEQLGFAVPDDLG